MAKTAYMSISEFSKLTGIKRANLIYYDNIGLLKPEHRSENNYRCYSQHQLKIAYIISSFRAVDISIEEIKTYTNQRTPEKMVALFETQEKHMQEEIIKLKQRKAMMKLQREMVLETWSLDISKVHLISRKEGYMFLGEIIESGVSEEEATNQFYDYAEEYEIELGNPFGAIVSKETLLSRPFVNQVKQFYLRLPQKDKDKKPAGRYVVGFMQGDYGQSEALYHRLLTYIQEHQLEICGDAYEEYPLFEMTSKDPSQYLIRIEIMVV